MTKEWEHIEDYFHAALSLKGEEREKYLSRVCDGKRALRVEVDSLLASFEHESEFLESPAFSLGLRAFENDLNISLTGQEISFYKVLDKLGSGGMGEVYLARDTRLDRQVALKFLSGILSGDESAKEQLKNEARAVAMLDHPNICPVYGFEEIGEHSFIVMQHVEGKTLSELIRQGAINDQQKMAIALQITGAIAAAHSSGIVHRDIKTGNIMLTPAGQVKVLDFGLAKIIERRRTEDAGQNVSMVSRNGLIVGTVAYMSPEQLRNDKLDYRTDVFSLGTVFCELMAGENPFCGRVMPTPFLRY